MPERPPSQPASPPAKEGNEPSFSRRHFLKILGGTALATGIAKGKDIKEAYDEYEQKAFLEDVERKKEPLRRHIHEEMERAETAQAALKRYNQLLSTTKDEKELARLNLILRNAWAHRGGLAHLLSADANPDAEALANNDKALTALAAAEVMLQSRVAPAFRKKDTFAYFPYWHNCAQAYLDLERTEVEEVQRKMKELFDYSEEHNLSLSRMNPEQIAYFLIDRSFDFSLTPDKMKTLLAEYRSDWNDFPATHVNRECYSSYNDLSKLDIFELNRLRAVVFQLSKPVFVQSLFDGRDEDLRKTYTELGGVIPLSHQEERAHFFPTNKEEGNDSYFPTAESNLRTFAGAAEFHFHATEMSEPANVHGPSGADLAYFAPGVVFTSLDEKQIVSHFYVGRGKETVDGFKHKSAVVCLGTVKK